VLDIFDGYLCVCIHIFVWVFAFVKPGMSVCESYEDVRACVSPGVVGSGTKNSLLLLTQVLGCVKSPV